LDLIYTGHFKPESGGHIHQNLQTGSELFLGRNRSTNQCIPFRNGLEHEENDGDSERENLFLFFKPIHPCFQLE